MKVSSYGASSFVFYRKFFPAGGAYTFIIALQVSEKQDFANTCSVFEKTAKKYRPFIYSGQ